MLLALARDWFPFDQGDMEQALENYDICTEMLQSSMAIQAEAGAEQRDIVIRLPNLHNHSVVSLEEVSGRVRKVILGRRFMLGWPVRPGRTCPEDQESSPCAA